MSFMCQKDSYLKEFDTTVKSCTPFKKKNVDGFNVVLEDTILFPEGGGQPCDWGTMNGMTVSEVKRVGADAIHFTETEMEAGSEVKLVVDWGRRFDHMQQHTGQHLVTATTDRLFGFKTTSWDIGTWPGVVTIELDTPTLSANQMKEIEEAANQSLQKNLAVTPSFYQDKEDPELKQFRGLGLPDDHVGVVRVLTIDGLDSTLCCGTHVSNLAHIQAIKIVSAEKGKKGKTNLQFLAGGRLLHYAQASFDREKKLTALLRGPGEKQCELAEKAVKHHKTLQKTCTTLCRDLASLEAKLFRMESGGEVFVAHRREADQDWVSVLLSEVGEATPIKLISTGDDKEGGAFVLAGPPQLLKDLGEKICEAFEGKGAVSRGVYRGKAGKPDRGRVKAEALVRTYLAVKGQRESGNSEDGSGQEEVADESIVGDASVVDNDSTGSGSDVEDDESVDGGNGEGKSKKKVKGKRLTMSNIPFKLDVDGLREMLKEDPGGLVKVELYERKDGKSRGMASMEFEDVDTAQRAVDKYHNKMIQQRQVKMRDETEKDLAKLKENRKMKQKKQKGVLGPAPLQPMSAAAGLSMLENVAGDDRTLMKVVERLGREGSSTVQVDNLNKQVTLQKVKDVFQLAGNIVLVKPGKRRKAGYDMNAHSLDSALVTFEHRFSALQAVSMFNEQKLYKNTLSVKLVNDAGLDAMKLPEGLGSIGRGLGPDGNPVTLAALHNGGGHNGALEMSLQEKFFQQEKLLQQQFKQQQYAHLNNGGFGLGNLGAAGLGYMGNVGGLGNMGGMGSLEGMGGMHMGNGDWGNQGNMAASMVAGDKGPRTVEVRNLSFQTDWRDLKAHFENIAVVKRAEVVKDANGRSSGYGYVRFGSFQEAQRAAAMKHNSKLDKRNLRVKLMDR